MGGLLRDAEELNIKGLKAVTVKKDELLEKIKEARGRHQSEFEEVLAGYKIAMVDTLAKALRDARKSGDFNRQALYNLSPPSNHTKDYDRVIQMLEMSVDELIELPVDEFARYALDEWSWKGQFETAKASYTKRG
jgi:hypothetical protein